MPERKVITDRKGLTPQEVAVLLQTEDNDLIGLILQAAHKIKSDIYGNRLVLFAPLYMDNHCSNNCLYCGFRKDNQELNRVVLTLEQIKNEVEVLQREGHKRLLILCGEHPTRSTLDYFTEAIETAYATKTEKRTSARLCRSSNAPGRRGTHDQDDGRNIQNKKKENDWLPVSTN